MKTYLTAISTLAIMAATPLFAGNLTPGTYDPPVMAPPSHNWTGLTFGGGITKRKSTTTITERVPDGYERTCLSGGSGHGDQKCRVSKEDYDQIDLREVSSPWNKNGLRNDGQPGEIVKYRAGYYGVWLNDQPSYTFQTDSINDPGGSRGASLSDVTQMFVDTFTLAEDEEVSGTVFARYLHDFGAGGGFVLGGEAGYLVGDSAYGEALAGIAGERLFLYGGYGTNGATAGIDLRIGQGSTTAGLKVTEFGDGEYRPEFRVAFGF